MCAYCVAAWILCSRHRNESLVETSDSTWMEELLITIWVPRVLIPPYLVTLTRPWSRRIGLPETLGRYIQCTGHCVLVVVYVVWRTYVMSIGVRWMRDRFGAVVYISARLFDVLMWAVSVECFDEHLLLGMKIRRSEALKAGECVRVMIRMILSSTRNYPLWNWKQKWRGFNIMFICKYLGIRNAPSILEVLAV